MSKTKQANQSKQILPAKEPKVKQVRGTHNSVTHHGVGWLGTYVEQHHRGQERAMEERIALVRSTTKGLENGLVTSIDPNDFKKELMEIAIQKIK